MSTCVSERSVSDEAADLFQQHRDELGFVNRAQVREGDLVVERRGGDVVGALLGNHCVRKDQSTVYELAVHPNQRRQGIGRSLIKQFAAESPHDRLVAKCPVDLPANEFYRQTGWSQIRTAAGKKRALNVWEYTTDDGIDWITTGRPDLTAIAAEYGWLRGTRLDEVDRYERAGVSPEFLDLHWESPDFRRLLRKTMRHRPQYVVAGDYDGENYEEVHRRAELLKPYAEHVIVVPHEPGEPARVPEWAISGYSTPTQYAGTDAPIWEYRQADAPVHVLGGTPNQQTEIIAHVGPDKVTSADINSHHRSATKYAKWWAGSEPHWSRVAEHKDATSVRRCYQNSMINYTYSLREKNLH